MQPRPSTMTTSESLVYCLTIQLVRKLNQMLDHEEVQQELMDVCCMVCVPQSGLWLHSSAVHNPLHDLSPSSSPVCVCLSALPQPHPDTCNFMDNGFPCFSPSHAISNHSV